jgi:hypothetical protein
MVLTLSSMSSKYNIESGLSSSQKEIITAVATTATDAII